MRKQKDYLTTREAAKRLDMAVSTIQLWTDNGLLSAWTTAGGHRRIKIDSVERLLQQKERGENIKLSRDPASIVIVEDNKQDQNLYKQHFELWELNAELHLCKDGYAGLITIGKIKPDIIISDLMMPNMNGFEMIKAINENSDLKDTLIIVSSALTEKEIKLRGGLPENVIIFRKPLLFEELEILIREEVNSYAKKKLNKA